MKKKDASKVDEDLRSNKKTIIKIAMKDIFLMQTLNILKGFKIFIVIYYFYLNKWKLKNAINFYAISLIKTITLYI